MPQQSPTPPPCVAQPESEKGEARPRGRAIEETGESARAICRASEGERYVERAREGRGRVGTDIKQVFFTSPLLGLARTNSRIHTHTHIHALWWKLQTYSKQKEQAAGRSAADGGGERAKMEAHGGGGGLRAFMTHHG
jgi:hypothetical protein